MATTSTDNSAEIQKWMEEAAQGRTPRKKLIYDKKTKRLVVVPPEIPSPDASQEFSVEDATRW